jgi:hypothetical protein
MDSKKHRRVTMYVYVLVGFHPHECEELGQFDVPGAGDVDVLEETEQLHLWSEGGVGGEGVRGGSGGVVGWRERMNL